MLSQMSLLREQEVSFIPMFRADVIVLRSRLLYANNTSWLLNVTL